MLPLVIASLLACGPRDPAWALDPVHLAPDGEGGVVGYHQWHLYDARFERSPRERTYACGAVMELVGSPRALCEGCTEAWDLSTTLLETDCDAIAIDLATLPKLTRVGLAPMAGDLALVDPYPGIAQLAMVGYDDGGVDEWGWAWPASLDHDGTADGPSWNDRQDFTLWPAYVWELAAL